MTCLTSTITYRWLWVTMSPSIAAFPIVYIFLPLHPFCQCHNLNIRLVAQLLVTLLWWWGQSSEEKRRRCQFWLNPKEPREKLSVNNSMRMESRRVFAFFMNTHPHITVAWWIAGKHNVACGMDQRRRRMEGWMVGWMYGIPTGTICRDAGTKRVASWSFASQQQTRRWHGRWGGGGGVCCPVCPRVAGWQWWWWWLL